MDKMLIDRVIVGNMFTNAYIISTGKKECILVDPGASPRIIIQRLEAMNLVPQSIIFTHGHMDHTSATLTICDHYRERGFEIPAGVHEGDAAFLGRRGLKKNRTIFGKFGDAGMQAYTDHATALPEPEFSFADGDTIEGTDLVVLHTPGHSEGSVCFYSEGRQTVFTGDTMFFNSIGRTDLPNASLDQIKTSIAERLFTLPGDTRLFPGHGPVSAVEREIKNNPMLSDGATI